MLNGSGCFESAGNKYTSKKNLNVLQRVTGEESESERERWDVFYSHGGGTFGREPAEILQKYVDLLPRNGKVLDLAMGEGRNAIYLAKKGFSVTGVDFSEAALRKAKQFLQEARVTAEFENADLNVYQIKPAHYDVILNIDYLQRSLIPQIKKGLKVGGVVVFENQTIDQLQILGSEGIRRDYLLQRGELKELFKDFKVIYYNEFNDGKNAKASLVAVKKN